MNRACKHRSYPRWGRALTTALTVMAACLVAAPPSHAEDACSQAQVDSLRANVKSAKSLWQSSRKRADHDAYVGARGALLSYATRCAASLQKPASTLLAGSIAVPFIESPDAQPGTRAPGDFTDLFITTVPTSISGSAGNTLTYTLLTTCFEKNAVTPIMQDYIFATESGTGASMTGFDDPNWANDSCTNNVGVAGALDGVFCALGEDLPYTFPPTYWAIRVEVTSPEGATLSSEASVHGAEFESSTLNNTTTASIRFSASSGLSISASGPSGVIAGNPISYTLSVTNEGPSTAEGVVVKDFVPTEIDITSFSASSGSCSNTPGSQTITCNVGNMSDGASRTITVNGTVKPNVPDATVIFNDAQVSSSTADPDNGDNVDSVATTVDAGTSGLSLVQTGPASATAGTDVVYTSTITNVGDTAANDAVFRIFGPTEMDVVDFSVSSGSCNVNAVGGPSCNLGTIAVGGSRIVTVTQHIRTSTPNGSILFHTGQVSSDAFESSNADNLDTDSTTIIGADSGLDVGITGPPTAIAGTSIDYDIVLNNIGPDAATNVQLKDVIPSEITVVGFTITQGNCGATGGDLTGTTVTCVVGTVASGAQVTGTIQGIVKAGVADGTILLNTVSASGSVYESDTANNSATASAVVDTQADLALDTVDSSDPINIDTPFRWVNTITNAGPSDAVNVVVTDEIPKLVEELKIRTLPAGCDRFEQTIKCALGTVKVGATVTMNIELEAMPNAGTSISHTATVSAVTDDPNAANDSDSETTTLQAPDLTGAFLSPIKTACDLGKQTCTVKGTFRVTNAGNAKSVQTTLRFVRSNNTTLGAGDPQLKKFTINQLKAGVSQDFPFTFSLPLDQYIIAQVDSENLEPEINENNNVFYKGPFPKP